MKYFLCSIFLLITISSVRSQEIYPEFYQKIEGTYTDNQTHEMVFLYYDNLQGNIKMFYQVDAYQVASKIKLMQLISVDTAQRKLLIRFSHSSYRCHFQFSTTYQSFICKNPDGSQQLFKKTKNVVRQSLAFFAAQFPTYDQPKLVIQSLNQLLKPIPVEVAYKFLESNDYQLKYLSFPKDSAEINSLKHSNQAFLKRYALYVSNPQFSSLKYFGSNNYYYFKRLLIYPDLITCLVKQKFVEYGGEYRYNVIKLLNYTSKGQPMDDLILAGTKSNLSELVSFHSVVDKNLIHRTSIRQAQGMMITTAKRKRKYIQRDVYQVLNSGKVKLLHSSYEYIDGEYFHQKKRINIGIESGKAYIEYFVGNSYKKTLLTKLSANHFKTKGSDAVKPLVLKFNDANTQITVTHPNGDKQLYLRKQYR